MQLFGHQLKAHKFVLKVLVVNTEYQFLGFVQKEPFKEYGYTMDPGQQDACSVVWSVIFKVTPPCIDCRGKNKIYENQVMHTYNICVWYPGWTSLVEPAQRNRWYSILIKMHDSHWLDTCLRTSPQQDTYRFLMHNKKHCESSTAPPINLSG